MSIYVCDCGSYVICSEHVVSNNVNFYCSKCLTDFRVAQKDEVESLIFKIMMDLRLERKKARYFMRARKKVIQLDTSIDKTMII